MSCSTSFKVDGDIQKFANFRDRSPSLYAGRSGVGASIHAQRLNDKVNTACILSLLTEFLKHVCEYLQYSFLYVLDERNLRYYIIICK